MKSKNSIAQAARRKHGKGGDVDSDLHNCPACGYADGGQVSEIDSPSQSMHDPDATRASRKSPRGEVSAPSQSLSFNYDEGLVGDDQTSEISDPHHAENRSNRRGDVAFEVRKARKMAQGGKVDELDNESMVGDTEHDEFLADPSGESDMDGDSEQFSGNNMLHEDPESSELSEGEHNAKRKRDRLAKLLK